MGLLKWLEEGDKGLFYLINIKCANPLLDNLMMLLRQPLTWVPLYFFILLFFITNCRKHLLPIIVLSLLTFTLSDFISASILKPVIGRLRPCHDASLAAINNLPGCGGLFSMPSSHAANHFALAAFWFMVIQFTTGHKWTWLWIWAAAVCFAQVYVGVHFPADVIMGGVLGVLIAQLTIYFFKAWSSKLDISSPAKV